MPTALAEIGEKRHRAARRQLTRAGIARQGDAMLPYSSLRAFNSVFSDAAIDDGTDSRRNLRLTQAKGFARFATEKAARRREVRKATARSKGKPVTLASKA